MYVVVHKTRLMWMEKTWRKFIQKLVAYQKTEEPTNLCERAMIPKNGVPGPSTQQEQMHEP